jgi:PhnB protein
VTDPFDVLRRPAERQRPRPAFAAELRARLATALGRHDQATGLDAIPTVQLPGRSTMPTTTPTTSAVTALTPYLTVRGAAEAIAWYREAFVAVEELRVVGDDGRVGHAELSIGEFRVMLSDEYPEIGVQSPATLGGATTAMHLGVADVDAAFARAVAAGAVAQQPPADQPHGARHGTILDPFGHRWMLSQQLEAFDVDTYRERSSGTGFEVVGAGPNETVTAADRPGTGGGIWAGAFYGDALAAIDFLVDVFGFERQLVVLADDERTVVHSQLRWPEGGVVQAGTYDPANVFNNRPGEQSLYVVTAEPHAVWERCRAAGVDVVREPEAPDHDPGGMGFSVRDPEGNIWSFGTYGLGETS